VRTASLDTAGRNLYTSVLGSVNLLPAIPAGSGWPPTTRRCVCLAYACLRSVRVDGKVGGASSACALARLRACMCACVCGACARACARVRMCACEHSCKRAGGGRSE
jgi:hypothetical protein